MAETVRKRLKMDKFWKRLDRLWVPHDNSRLALSRPKVNLIHNCPFCAYQRNCLVVLFSFLFGSWTASFFFSYSFGLIFTFLKWFLCWEHDHFLGLMCQSQLHFAYKTCKPSCSFCISSFSFFLSVLLNYSA